MESKTGQWLIVIFDALLAVLFIMLLFGNIADVRRPAPDLAANDMLIDWADCGLDVLAFASQLCAALAVASGRKSAALLQRAVFWSLLVRTGFIFAEAFLPDAGLGGFFLLVGGVIFLALTGLALWSVAHLHKAERSAA